MYKTIISSHPDTNFWKLLILAHRPNTRAETLTQIWPVKREKKKKKNGEEKEERGSHYRDRVFFFLFLSRQRCMRPRTFPPKYICQSHYRLEAGAAITRVWRLGSSIGRRAFTLGNIFRWHERRDTEDRGKSTKRPPRERAPVINSAAFNLIYPLMPRRRPAGKFIWECMLSSLIAARARARIPQRLARLVTDCARNCRCPPAAFFPQISVNFVRETFAIEKGRHFEQCGWNFRLTITTNIF